MLVYIAVFLGGLAALTWEILWLHFANLAIGVSAQAAAIILSAMMFGMAVGSLAVGAILPKMSRVRATRALAVCEIFIGIVGFFLYPSFLLVERLDAWVFLTFPQMAPLFQCLGIVLALGVPSLLMGATVPIYTRMANEHNMSVARVYATNVVGASLGILLVSFLLIPKFGVDSTIRLTVCLNIIAAFFALLVKPLKKSLLPQEHSVALDKDLVKYSLFKSAVVVFCTGFATFSLEVVWFRSLRATLQATTESFALMLFTTLVALSLGGFLSTYLRRRKRIPLSCLIGLAGFLVFQVTPMIERFDLYVLHLSGAYGSFMLKRFCFVFITLGPPMCVLGIGLPWLLESHKNIRVVSVLYSINTFGAVLGSLIAAWLFLPLLGFVKGAWVVGGVLIGTALILSRGKEYFVVLSLGLLGFLMAFFNQSDVGLLRIQGVPFSNYKVLESREGPDSTVAVVEDKNGIRHLFIDGYSASDEGRKANYMDWMGRLPMLLHSNPQDVLVICYGTGQTANAVRLESPKRLDIVDVNSAVFEMAPYFVKSQKVLEDPRSRKIVMDGRAFLRRVKQNYDVVTLEPMPPTFAGSNALYSREFYQLIFNRLRINGVAAQWLPFHLVDPEQSASIVAAFIDVFDDSILWIDPVSHHGILLGFKREPNTSIPLTWYGFQRDVHGRGLTNLEIERSLIFDENVLVKFSTLGKAVSDDNQLLSYGYGRMKWWSFKKGQAYIIDLLKEIAD